MKASYILIALLLSVYSSFSQSKPEDKLVNDITLALKSCSDSAIQKCLPSLDDFKKLVELQKTSSDIQMPEAASIYKSITGAAYKTFKETLETGRRNGVNWSSISLVKAELKEEPREAEPVLKGDIYITYQENNHQFIIKLVDCIRVNNEWKLMDRIWWYKSL